VFMRSLALSCVLLYALVGFVAGACPSSPNQLSSSQSAHHQHHQPKKPAAHALACAWACHASANDSAIDVSTQLVPIWVIVLLLAFPEGWIGVTRHLLIFARPPPLFVA
jgi:hypothetical protein